MDRSHIERKAKRPGQGEFKEEPDVLVGRREEAKNIVEEEKASGKV